MTIIHSDAAEHLKSLGKIAAAEPLAIWRHIIRELDQKSIVAEIVNPDANIREVFKELAQALRLFNRKGSFLSRLIHAYNIAACHRRAVRLARQELFKSLGVEAENKGIDVDDAAEKEVNDFVESRGRESAHALALGVRAMTLTFCMTPKSLVGLLLIPWLDLDEVSLRQMPEPRLICLYALITLTHWDEFKMRLLYRRK